MFQDYNFKCFRDSLIYFYSPSEILEKQNTEKIIRIGGLVEENSVSYKNSTRISSL